MLFNESIFLDNVGKIIVFLMLLFTVFLITVKSHKKLANLIFASFLIVTAFDMTGLFLNKFYTQYPGLQHIKTASSLLQMPLFYFYVLAMCYTNFRFQLKYMLHAFPFVIFLIVFYAKLFPHHASQVHKIIGEIQYFVYIFTIFYVLNRHKTVYLQNFSNPDYSAYKWLFNATLIFCIAHTFVIVRWILNSVGSSHQSLAFINAIIGISALSVTCWLVMKAMYKPYLFIGVESELKPIKSEQKGVETPKTNESLQKLTAFMEAEKPYLDYELSLSKLAGQVKMEEKELSLLINQYTGKHFFDFINSYRINAAKAILENPKKSKMTVLEILYQVGFNSKSSFYTAFKKEVGQTPINYRKSFS